MAWSSALFVGEVWPLIRPCIGGGALMQIENSPDRAMASMLDMRCGVDAWHLHTDGVRGIASRIQSGCCYRTFTVRMRRHTGGETEFAKLERAITSGRGWLRPQITVQAYAKTQAGPVLCVGVTNTDDLYRFIKSGFHTTRSTPGGREVFAVCDWAQMKVKGFHVRVIEPAQAKRAA